MKFKIQENALPLQRLINIFREETLDPEKYLTGDCYYLSSALFYLYNEGEIYNLEMYFEKDKEIIKHEPPVHSYFYFENKFWDIEGSHFGRKEMTKNWQDKIKQEFSGLQKNFFEKKYKNVKFKIEKSKPLSLKKREVKEVYEKLQEINKTYWV